MRLSIQHHTVYRYDSPAEYAAQVLRLTPRSYDGFSVLSWTVSSGGTGRLSTFDDGYGNASHIHTVAQMHDSVEIHVTGVVETSDTDGVVRGATETLPLGAWLRSTPLTATSDSIESLAAEAAGGATHAIDVLRQLMSCVRERIDYRSGCTDVMTTAAAALDGGSGVCQDHAHVFLAAARSLGIPARYVGGYLCLEGKDVAESILESLGSGPHQEAGHAWAEAYDPELGWIAFDPANNTIAGPWHVRTSVGLDYASAAPVRGVRRDRGGICGAEILEVDVHVSRLGQQ